MHARYILLNIVFLAPLILAAIVRRKALARKQSFVTFGLLCVLTAVFDNCMIAFGVMKYDPTHICGLKIGLAPIEDFAYTLAAVLWVALLWKRKQVL
jgi:lycopene cyclase domain-containing protein